MQAVSQGTSINTPKKSVDAFSVVRSVRPRKVGKPLTEQQRANILNFTTIWNSKEGALGSQFIGTQPTGFFSSKVVSMEQVSINPNRARQAGNLSIDGLAESISEVGQLTPVLVAIIDSQNPPKYEIVSGARRYHALTQLKRKTIRVNVVSGHSTASFSLIENLQRENLHPLDEARWISELKLETGLSDEKIGRMLGKKRTTVTQSLGIARLSVEVVERIRKIEKAPSKEQLVELSQCANDCQQKEVLKMIEDGETRAEIRKCKKGKSDKKGRAKEINIANVMRTAISMTNQLDSVAPKLLSKIGDEDLVKLSTQLKAIVQKIAEIERSIAVCTKEYPSDGPD